MLDSFRGQKAHLETRDMAVPGSIALGVLCGHSHGCAIGPPEDDGAADGAGRHVESLGRRVDDLVNGLHGKVEGHELHHRAQP